MRGLHSVAHHTDTRHIPRRGFAAVSKYCIRVAGVMAASLAVFSDADHGRDHPRRSETAHADISVYHYLNDIKAFALFTQCVTRNAYYSHRLLCSSVRG